jgi:hypothetical protein
MPDRDNAELWERTTLVISEERAAPPRANRRLIARGASARGRRVGPRVAEGSEAGLVQVIAARVFKRSRVDGPVRSSRATATT